MNAYQHVAPRKILEVDETLTEVERLRVPGSMESTAGPDNSQWLAVARNQGYVRALMVRVKLLHQYLLSEFLFDAKAEQQLGQRASFSVCSLC